ncbi:unnamed protein product [Umbelopsis ramanniana]
MKAKESEWQNTQRPSITLQRKMRKNFFYSLDKKFDSELAEDECLQQIRDMAGGVPVWPLGIEPTFPLFTIVDGLCNVLENVCPKFATPKELSASPGEFVPIMNTILEIYETVSGSPCRKPNNLDAVIRKAIELEEDEDDSCEKTLARKLALHTSTLSNRSS